MDERVDGAGDRGKLASSISNAVVGIHRQYFGRGASRARTVMGADYVICFLEDIYTPVERTLIEAGRFPAVQETRTAFQDTMRDRFSNMCLVRNDASPIGAGEVHLAYFTALNYTLAYPRVVHPK